MSDERTERWLVDARENFEQALHDEGWEFAAAVIEDVEEAGFKDAAETLRADLFRAIKAEEGD